MYCETCGVQGDDSVVECTNEGGKIELHMSWNSGKRNTRFATVSIVYYAMPRTAFATMRLCAN